MRTVLFLLTAMSLATGSAHAAVTVFGSDSATQCSQAAIAGRSDYGAQAYCTRALEQDQMNDWDRAGTFVNRGVMKLRRADYKASQADFDAALSLVPTMAEAWVNRGAMWVGEKHYRPALNDLNRALELGVKEPEKAYYDRALAYEGLDDETAAYFDYRKALELKPDWELPQHELLRFHVSTRAVPG